MSKGKFGLSLAAVAVIAFGFSALRQPQSVLLVAGFALLAEKDEWLNKQAMQALLLTIVYYVAELVNDWIFGGLARFFEWVELYDVLLITLFDRILLTIGGRQRQSIAPA